MHDGVGPDYHLVQQPDVEDGALHQLGVDTFEVGRLAGGQIVNDDVSGSRPGTVVVSRWRHRLASDESGPRVTTSSWAGSGRHP